MNSPEWSREQSARWVRDQTPPGGLFADQHWRISPVPLALPASMVAELESLGRVLLQFYKAINLLYRQSGTGKQPEWIAHLYDQGKPASLLDWQRHPAFKGELPRVIRPDLLWTDQGFALTELDSVPGGVGLTAWLHRTYAQLAAQKGNTAGEPRLIGGPDGMVEGFRSIFGDARRVHVAVSAESGSYRPEMEWLCGELGRERFQVTGVDVDPTDDGDAIYRFFELFDLANIPASGAWLEKAAEKRIRLTPAYKPVLEEKLSLALLWNRNLRSYWRQELGDGFLTRLQKIVPYSWVVDPTPLPPHAAIPELGLTDWQQLKQLSQKERDLILKVSGYSEEAWGARGVYLGSDLSQADWSSAVDKAIHHFDRSPFVLQRYHKPKVVDFSYLDFTAGQEVPMPSRVRLCPYYFVAGDGDSARAQLGGVLATACPADKKIIHGMRDAVLAPCSIQRPTDRGVDELHK
jgi:hypothetical protein